MLLSYIKRRWKTIAAMAIFAAMFAMVFSLYELPAEAVLYASLLCVAVGALLLAASYASYRRRVKTLELLRRTICVSADGLPEPRDLTEELYQELQERNINLIGVGTDSGESREQLDTAREILREKGVTYINISPDPEGAFYQDFVAELSTYPTTCIVDRAGNIVGADIVGNVKKQLDTVEARLDLILAEQDT